MLDRGDLAEILRSRLRLGPVPGLPEISLYTAHPGSRLAELAGDATPYWAYVWSGGAALARHLLDHADLVRGRRVLDLGAGGGIVAIAAARAGAAAVTAAEIDPRGVEVLRLNAEANNAMLEIVGQDLSAGAPPPVDIILAGDVFYAPGVAARVLPFLTRCRAAGIDVLVGDPGRKDLPTERLRKLADYRVPEVGSARAEATTLAAVYALDPA